MKILKRLLKYYLKYLPRIILGLISIVLLTQCDALNAFFSKILYEIFQAVGQQKINHQDFHYLFSYKFLNIHLSFEGAKDIFLLVFYLVIGVFVNIIFKGIFVYAQEYTLNSAVYKTLRDIRQDVYKSIIKYPMAFFDLNKTGDLMAKITNDVNMMEGTYKEFNNKVKELFQTLFFLFFLFYLNWKLSMVIIVVFSITGYVMKKFSMPIRKAQRRIVENISHITSFLQETLSGIKIIKIFVKENKEINQFKDLTQATYARNMKQVRLTAFQKPINELLSIIGIIVVIIVSSYQIIIKGDLDPAEFVQYFIFLMLVYKPIKGFQSINLAIQTALASGKRIFDLIDMDTEDKIYRTSKRMRTLEGITGRMEFKNISFYYKPGEPVLKNINFTVKPGEVVAIVGHSGSGKTTIVNLIPLFYKAGNGKILIDGINIKDIEYTSLRKFIAMVPQDTFLFSGSVKDNIAYAVDNAADEQIIEAAKQANAHNFIMKFKNKYNTEVGEKGVQLSGGEKQRISIARAILKNPKILILDEATSALDTRSELLVQNALNGLMKNRTTFIIAHRLSTIKHADKILVLEDGEIKQMGSHAHLIKKINGLYYKLCHAQQLFK